MSPNLEEAGPKAGARRHWALFIVAAGLAALVGCGAPAWKIVRDMPPPSPLRGSGPVVVSFDYSKLDIDGMNEREWVQSKLAADPDYEAQWAKLKSLLETNFVMGFNTAWPPGALPGPPGPQGVHVLVTPVSMTMGKYMVVAATATSVNAALAFTVNGRDAEEIELMAAKWASIYQPSVFQHMPAVGSLIGENAGRFVKSRNE